MISISCGVPTKNRYESLSLCLLSLAFQSFLPKEIIIVDDSDNPVQLTTIPIYRYIFQLFDDKGIKWKCVWGQKRGQHISHQIIQDIAEGEYIFRCDDDVVCEPNVLEELVKCIEQGSPMAMDENSDVYYQKPVGAVAPLVLLPNPTELPEGLVNDIRFMNQPNVQWFTQKNPTVMTADHLHCSYLYKRGAAKYEMGLTSASFREESLHSHSIKRIGYELLITGHARVWHFMNTEVRNKNVELYQKDDAFFHAQLRMWGVNSNDESVFILDNGRGDHFAFKNLLPKLKDKNVVIAACFPDVFFDVDDVKLISIAEAQLLLKDLTPFNLYKWMIDHSFKGNLIEAFEKMYNL